MMTKPTITIEQDDAPAAAQTQTAFMDEDLLAVCARKIAHINAREPAHFEWQLRQGGGILAHVDRDAGWFRAIQQAATLRKNYPVPMEPLREFIAIITPQGEPAYERTSWSSCSVDALIDNLKLLDHAGVARVHIEVRPL